MVRNISRRHFIGLLCAVGAVVRQGNAGAQAPALPTIGFFSNASPYEWAPFVAAFREGLKEMGYNEGRNVAVEFRWGFGDREKLPALARDMASRHLDVVVVNGGFSPLSAIREAIPNIPIVAVFGGNPVQENFMASLEHPGGRITGVSLASVELEIRRLQIIREMVSGMTKIGFVADPRLPTDREQRRHFENGTRQLGLDSVVVDASSESEIDEAFSQLSKARVSAVEIASTVYYLDRRDRLVALAARHKLPTIYPAGAYVDAGGLVSYGVDRTETYRQLGRYTGTVLKGGNPAEMPVLQPAKFELAINARAAKALGLTVPPSLLTLADTIVR